MGENHYAAECKESTTIIEYTVPRATANVLVDRLGYRSLRNKESAIKGRERPRQLRLINADTGEYLCGFITYYAMSQETCNL